MHEISLCRGLLQQVIQISDEHQASVIKSIQLKIGPLSGVEVELLKRSFPLVSQGTAAQDATLEITIMPVTVQCNECKTKSDITGMELSCPHCDSASTTLLNGDEMTLENVVLEQHEVKVTHHVH